MARVTLENVSETQFTESTIRAMYRLVDSSKVDREFQKLVTSVVNGSMRGQWKNYRGELETLLNWARKAVDYRRDPAGVELVQDVWATLDRGAGDCDDFVVLFCSAAETLGAPCRFVTISTKANLDPSHVYAEVLVDGIWTPADCIVPWAPLGWAPTEGITARRVWDRASLGLSGYDESSIEGVGMHDSGPVGWADDHYKSNGHGNQKYEGGFAAPGRAVFNPDGIPNNVSMTYGGAGEPGDAIEMLRFVPSRLLETPADPRQVSRAGGGAYNPNNPIQSYPTPDEAFALVQRSSVPFEFDPTVWAGAVPYSEMDPRAMLPGPLAQEGSMMSGLGSNGGMVFYSDLEAGLSQDQVNTVASIAKEVVPGVQAGLIPSNPDFIQGAINAAVNAWALSQQADITESQAKLRQAEAERIRAQAALVTASATAETGIPIYKRPWFFPVVAAAAVFLFKGGAALFGGGGGKKKYRRNPGGDGMKKYLPLAIGAGAVYWLSTRKHEGASVSKPTAAPQTGGAPQVQGRVGTSTYDPMVTYAELEAALRV